MTCQHPKKYPIIIPPGLYLCKCGAMFNRHGERVRHSDALTPLFIQIGADGKEYWCITVRDNSNDDEE